MLQAYAMTDIGRRRKMNQDFVFLSESPIGNLPNLFLLADGMGGHKAGDCASRMAAETIAASIAVSAKSDPVALLDEAIRSSNTQIRAQAREHAELLGMGTTVVAATIAGDCLQVANVGDSRLYLIRDGIRQITVDHSWVEDMVRLGGIDRSTARTHPDKNIITRAVGAEDTVVPDFFQETLLPGDVVLLCSDGLTNMVEDADIGSIAGGAGSLAERAGKLIAAANENGGRDNISVIIIEPLAEE